MDSASPISQPLILNERDPPVGWLILNRPEKLNAFNLALWQALPEELAKLEQDPAIRVILIRGAGDRAFGAGADISEFEDNRSDAGSAASYAESNERAFNSLRNCAKPTVAVIHGFCVGGGCAVALCADIRICARDARFALTPARLGLGYAFSGVEHAVRELGPAAARYLFLTASQIEADKALQLGVVQEVHESGELLDRAKELALKIAGNAPKTLRAIKESVRQSLLSGPERDPTIAEELIRECFASLDYQEGLRAFAEKRNPEFRDQ